jgi:hypothetical protein
MTISYDPTLSTVKDQVRFYYGDTIVTSALFSDDEILAMLVLFPDARLCAAEFADALAARFSKSVSFSVEGLNISNSQKSKNYRELANRLRAQASSSLTMGTAFVGGVSIGELRGIMSNSDRPRSRFAVEPDGNQGYLAGDVLPELSSEWP